MDKLCTYVIPEVDHEHPVPLTSRRKRDRQVYPRLHGLYAAFRMNQVQDVEGKGTVEL